MMSGERRGKIASNSKEVRVGQIMVFLPRTDHGLTMRQYFKVGDELLITDLLTNGLNFALVRKANGLSLSYRPVHLDDLDKLPEGIKIAGESGPATKVGCLATEPLWPGKSGQHGGVSSDLLDGLEQRELVAQTA